MTDGKVEWRVVDGFPGYEIHALGSIYNIRTGRQMKPGYTKKGAFYLLRNDGGVQVRCYMEDLIVTTFPELVWRVIPEFPIYEINRFGDIRAISTRRNKTIQFEKYSYAVRLWYNGKQKSRSLPKLLEDIWGPLASGVKTRKS